MHPGSVSSNTESVYTETDPRVLSESSWKQWSLDSHFRQITRQCPKSLVLVPNKTNRAVEMRQTWTTRFMLKSINITVEANLMHTMEWLCRKWPLELGFETAGVIRISNSRQRSKIQLKIRGLSIKIRSWVNELKITSWQITDVKTQVKMDSVFPQWVGVAGIAQ